MTLIHTVKQSGVNTLLKLLNCILLSMILQIFLLKLSLLNAKCLTAIQDADEDNKQIVSSTNGRTEDANNSVVVVPVKKIKVTSENGGGLHNNGISHVQNTFTPHTNSNGNANHRTMQRSPKILTARKRTKNGLLKAPTELWLV